MKKACFLLACALAARTLPAQVVISPNNPANPHASAMLDVQSTDKGMLVPRMTTAQRTAIANPAKGLLVFDTNTNTFWFYNGSAWGPVDGNTVPSTGIILSETENNPALTAAGFSLIGETKMLVKPTGGTGSFAWTGETSLDGAPSARTGHTAVWTGTEMIVWGGDTNGGRYNPATDTWGNISSDNAPYESYYLHTAIWTGTEMIVWGGEGSNNMDSYAGSRYNPVTDTWAIMDTTTLGRSGHTAIWTGTEMIVWGGSTSGDLSNTGARYNPSTNSWMPISTVNAPSPRTGHTAIWTGTEMIVWGGASWGSRYNPTTDTWTPITSGASTSEHTAVWTGTEMIIWGAGGVGRYNPTTDTWLPISHINAPSNRRLHSAVWTGTLMLVWGGRSGNSESAENYACGVYNPATNTWTATVPRNDFAFYPSSFSVPAIWTGNSMIVWGVGNSWGHSNTGYILTPSQNKTLYLFQKN